MKASEINYTVLATSAKKKGVETGDFCAVHAIKKNKTVFAIVGDTGHSSGAEGSLALLQRLGFKVKNGKSVDEEITNIVVRYFAKTTPTKQFFFKQADLDTASKALDLDRMRLTTHAIGGAIEWLSSLFYFSMLDGFAPPV